MRVKDIISDRISYIFKELSNGKGNTFPENIKHFLLVSLDLYLNALEYIENNQSDRTEMYFDASEINAVEIVRLAESNNEIYIGTELPVQNEDEILKSLREKITEVKEKLGSGIGGSLPTNIHVLLPLNIIEMPEYETIKETSCESLFDIFDGDKPVEEIQRKGYEYIASHGIGVVLLAGGGGTRFKNSIEDLRNNPDDAQNKWTLKTLNRSGVLEKIDAEIAKVVAPMTAIANNSPIQENLESVASIVRDYKPEMPVVIMVGPTTEQAVMELLRKNNNFGIKNIAVRMQGKLPFINESTQKVIDTEGGILDGANGGGGTLLALGLSGLRDNEGNIFYKGSAYEWFKALGVENIIMAQTDDAKDKEIYTGFAGVMASCASDGRNGMVSFGSDYPNSYKEVVKDGKTSMDADFKIGSVWDFFNKDGEKVKTAIVEYNELDPNQKGILFDVFKGRHGSRIIGNLGSYMLSMELASKVINENVLPLHFQTGKKEKTEDGRNYIVTKFEYFMTDVLEIASLTGNRTGILMVRKSDNYDGHLKHMAIDSIPLKDVYKLAIAQQSKLYKDRCKAEAAGIKVGADAVVEFSNLSKIASVGENVAIMDNARVLFGGDYIREHDIKIGNDVFFGGNVTVIIKGDKNVVIEDGKRFESESEETFII